MQTFSPRDRAEQAQGTTTVSGDGQVLEDDVLARLVGRVEFHVLHEALVLEVAHPREPVRQELGVDHLDGRRQLLQVAGIVMEVEVVVYDASKRGYLDEIYDLGERI